MLEKGVRVAGLTWTLITTFKILQYIFLNFCCLSQGSGPNDFKYPHVTFRGCLIFAAYAIAIGACSTALTTSRRASETSKKACARFPSSPAPEPTILKSSWNLSIFVEAKSRPWCIDTRHQCAFCGASLVVVLLMIERISWMSSSDSVGNVPDVKIGGAELHCLLWRNDD